MKATEAERLIDRYFDEQLEAVQLEPHLVEAAVRVWPARRVWRSTGCLDRGSAVRVWLWATDRVLAAGRAGPQGVAGFEHAQGERRVLEWWLSEHGHLTAAS